MTAQHTNFDSQLIADPRTAARQGTPLGRIVAGVFLGLLAWTIVMAVIGAALISVAGSKVEDAINDSASTSDTSAPFNISAPCKAVIDAGADASEMAQCEDDDTFEILRYQATK